MESVVRRPQRRVYNSTSLGLALAEFERAYGMASADFYQAYLDRAELPVPNFERSVWASFYEDALRMREQDDSADVMHRVAEAFAVA